MMPQRPMMGKGGGYSAGLMPNNSGAMVPGAPDDTVIPPPAPQTPPIVPNNSDAMAPVVVDGENQEVTPSNAAPPMPNAPMYPFSGGKGGYRAPMYQQQAPTKGGYRPQMYQPMYQPRGGYYGTGYYG